MFTDQIFAVSRPGLALLGVLALAAAGCAPAGAASRLAPRPDCRLESGPAGAAGAQVRWILPPDAADRPQIDAWCASVGPPVHQQLSEPGALPVRVDSILLVTWNVHVGGGDVRSFVADLRAGRMTDGQPVEHFALLLQEAYRTGDEVPDVPPGGRAARRIATLPPGGERVDIVTVAAELGLALFYVPSMRNGGGRGVAPEDRGNAILATLPLHDPAAIELPLEAQRRVGAAATLRIRGAAGERRALRLVSVHLDHRSRLSRALASFGPARRRQANAAAAALAQDSSSVLGGDLNTWAPGGLETVPALLGELFPDTPEADGRPTFRTGGLLPLRLDHLYFRLQNGFASEPTRIDARYGSDHHPVFAWISFASEQRVTTSSRADDGATRLAPELQRDF